MITIEKLSKSFDQERTWAVRQLDLQVHAGEFLVLLGESGSGKTTTLKMINRLIEPSSGRVRVDGEDTQAVDPVQLRRRIGYVFQGIGLFPHLSVADNVAAVPRLLGWPSAKTRERTDELLELVGLPPGQYRDREPRQLSGGQQQRVGLARALAARPRVMLMDEPFGALDPITRDELQGEFSRLHQSLGLTVVMVTHDMTEALLMADRIAVMRQGEFAAVGTPRRLLTGVDDEYVRRLLATPKRQADQLEQIAHGEDTE
jgi:osmoprotectant transport system ATP-binding protein